MKKNILHRSLLNSSNEILTNYLTMTALEDGFQVNFSKSSVLEYCIDGDGEWKTLNTFTDSVNTGQTVSFRGELTPTGTTGIGRFYISKQCDLSGDCMSLLYGDNAKDAEFVPEYAFYQLFVDCEINSITSDNFLHASFLSAYCYYWMFDSSSIKTVPENLLPAGKMMTACYGFMFSFCTKLTNAPKLPATYLATQCYINMFEDCIQLTTAPELPAKTLYTSCYENMFVGCKNLNYIKMLSLEYTHDSMTPTRGWVAGVASTGTFVKNMNAHIEYAVVENLFSGIPSGWTVIDDEE